jgi:hypothetical protein
MVLVTNVAAWHRDKGKLLSTLGSKADSRRAASYDFVMVGLDPTIHA